MENILSFSEISSKIKRVSPPFRGPKSHKSISRLKRFKAQSWLNILDDNGKYPIFGEIGSKNKCVSPPLRGPKSHKSIKVVWRGSINCIKSIKKVYNPILREYFGK